MYYAPKPNKFKLITDAVNRAFFRAVCLETDKGRFQVAKTWALNRLVAMVSYDWATLQGLEMITSKVNEDSIVRNVVLSATTYMFSEFSCHGITNEELIRIILDSSPEYNVGSIDYEENEASSGEKNNVLANEMNARFVNFQDLERLWLPLQSHAEHSGGYTPPRSNRWIMAIILFSIFGSIETMALCQRPKDDEQASL